MTAFLMDLHAGLCPLCAATQTPLVQTAIVAAPPILIASKLETLASQTVQNVAVPMPPVTKGHAEQFASKQVTHVMKTVLPVAILIEPATRALAGIFV
jgi:hypothetical protein